MTAFSFFRRYACFFRTPGDDGIFKILSHAGYVKEWCRAFCIFHEDSWEWRYFRGRVTAFQNTVIFFWSTVFGLTAAECARWRWQRNYNLGKVPQQLSWKNNIRTRQDKFKKYQTRPKTDANAFWTSQLGGWKMHPKLSKKYQIFYLPILLCDAGW